MDAEASITAHITQGNSAFCDRACAKLQTHYSELHAVSQDALAKRLLYRDSTDKEAVMTSNNSPSVDTPNVDTVIVGGGVAGLAAAAFVAHAGRRVVVLERSSHIGGRAITEERSGYYFNLGPHALYKVGHAANILSELGVDVHGGEPPTAGKALSNGELHTLPSSPTGVLTTSLLDLGEKIEMGRIFATFQRQDAQAQANVSLQDLIPIVSVVEDVAYLRQLNSPLLEFLRDFGDDARIPAIIQRDLDDGSAVMSRLQTTSTSYWSEVHGALSELEANRVSALDGFDEDEAAHFLENSNIIECNRGDRVLKKAG